MQNRSTFNVGNATHACPAVCTKWRSLPAFFPLTPLLLCWVTRGRAVQGSGCSRILTGMAGGGRAETGLLGLRGTRWGAQEGNCADAQEGNWEPLSRLPPSLAVLSPQRYVVHAQCPLALRRFSFVAARLKTVGCSCFIV